MNSEVHQKIILIPKDRIAALLGKYGRDKRAIQRAGKLKLKVDSNLGEVTILARDAVSAWTGEKVVEAIGRGFSPSNAIKLFKEEFELKILDLQDYKGRTKKSQARLKSRVIGSEGKTKRLIQRYTGTEISVYGKTISIIGKLENVEEARQALETILSGSKQGTALAGLRVRKSKR